VHGALVDTMYSPLQDLQMVLRPVRPPELHRAMHSRRAHPRPSPRDLQLLPKESPPQLPRHKKQHPRGRLLHMLTNT
jgi:hypothetical protein